MKYIRFVLLLIIIFTVIGCEETDNTISDSVKTFINAVNQGDKTAAKESVTDSSVSMIDFAEIKSKKGIFHFINTSDSMNENENYKLLVKNITKESAQVNILPVNMKPDPFSDSRLPKTIKEDGLAIYVKKENGKWKVDLLETNMKMLDILVNDIQNFDKIPDWFPGSPVSPTTVTPPWQR